jgi:hypothetical protein
MYFMKESRGDIKKGKRVISLILVVAALLFQLIGCSGGGSSGGGSTSGGTIQGSGN